MTFPEARETSRSLDYSTRLFRTVLDYFAQRRVGDGASGKDLEALDLRQGPEGPLRYAVMTDLRAQGLLGRRENETQIHDLGLVFEFIVIRAELEIAVHVQTRLRLEFVDDGVFDWFSAYSWDLDAAEPLLGLGLCGIVVHGLAEDFPFIPYAGFVGFSDYDEAGAA